MAIFPTSNLNSPTEPQLCCRGINFNPEFPLECNVPHTKKNFDLWYYKNKDKTESTFAVFFPSFGIAVRLFLLKYFLVIQIYGQMCEYEGYEGIWRMKVVLPGSSCPSKILIGPYEMDGEDQPSLMSCCSSSVTTLAA